MAWLKAEHRHVDYRDYLPENVYLETVMRRPRGVFTHDRHSGNTIWKYVFNLILLFYIAYALCAPSYQIGSGASAPFPRLPPNETTTLPLRKMFDWTMVPQFWHSVARATFPLYCRFRVDQEHRCENPVQDERRMGHGVTDRGPVLEGTYTSTGPSQRVPNSSSALRGSIQYKGE